MKLNLKLRIYLILWILSLRPAPTGESLPEDDLNTLVCAGEKLRGSCPTGNKIVVRDIHAGAKLLTKCGTSNTSDECCKLDQTDCLINYTATEQQAACTGRELCKDVSVSLVDTDTCGNEYPDLNHYIRMQYYCVPNERISSWKTTFLNTTNKLLYLQNLDYPQAVRDTQLISNCSIETKNCFSKIQTYFVDFDLYETANGTCMQYLQIVDKSVIKTFTCLHNNNYNISVKFNSSSNYIIVSFMNPDGVHDGKLWIGFQALSVTKESVILSLNCPAEAQTICMDCPQLQPIMNGNVSTEEGLATYQNATYYCNPGYSLVGESNRTCQENGTWTSEEPICQLIVCIALRKPPNGMVSFGANSTVGQNAIYTCNEGFRLEGSSVRTCENSGSWSGNEPLCIKRICPALSNLPNGVVSLVANSTVGENANYTCNEGFRLEGSTMRTCENSGSWSGDEPLCINIVCPPLRSPPNGMVSVRVNATVGQNANYTCNEGFIVKGSNRRTCKSNGTWSGDEPLCIVITCKGFEAPANGRISISGVHIGDSANFSCNPGYRINGTATRTCTADGTWNGTDTTCTMQGPDIVLIVGIIAGSVAFLLVICGVVFYKCRSKQQTRIAYSNDAYSDGVTVEDVKQENHEASKTVDSKDGPFTRTEQRIKIKEDVIQENSQTCKSLGPQHGTLEGMDQEINEADLKLTFDDESSGKLNKLKDLAAELFRSASLAKRNITEKGQANEYTLPFDVSADSDWSRGLISAAKNVLAAIYSMCEYANELAEGKIGNETMKAAANEVKRATNGLLVAYRIEGEFKSTALKDLKNACKALNQIADSLVKTTVKHSEKSKSVTLEEGEVRKARRRIELQATVIRKEKELQDAQESVAQLNQEQNKYENDLKQRQITEL